jgi:hypothetical protein
MALFQQQYLSRDLEEGGTLPATVTCDQEDHICGNDNQEWYPSWGASVFYTFWFSEYSGPNCIKVFFRNHFAVLKKKIISFG